MSNPGSESETSRTVDISSTDDTIVDIVSEEELPRVHYTSYTGECPTEDIFDYERPLENYSPVCEPVAPGTFDVLQLPLHFAAPVASDVAEYQDEP